MSADTTYDYAIVGAGVAGLNLVLAMEADTFFNNKRILVIDDGQRQEKTLCFWAKENGRMQDVILQSWPRGRFYSKEHALELDMESYQYNMTSSTKLRTVAFEKLAGAQQFDVVEDVIQGISQEGSLARLEGKTQTFRARHVFDSRVEMNPDWAKNTIDLKQHFLGWVIEIPEDKAQEKEPWDTSAFTMMDFRVNWEDSTSFTYVLPFSKTKALVEFTLFNQELLTQEAYEAHLTQYVREVLQLTDYNIVETETGVIPMSTYPFHKHHSKLVTKIGTAGGWVKPSTGYSFRNAIQYSEAIVANLEAGRTPSSGIACGRHRYYDKLFLDQLARDNSKGEALFDTMYRKNGTTRIFRFLDEESSFGEDLKVMASFNPLPFMASILRTF